MNRRINLPYLVVILILASGIILPVIASDNGFLYPLKPSPSTGPYDDKKFMDYANAQITGFSGKVIPSEGIDLLNLKSTQIQLSRMNISPAFYPKASLINVYLYKIGNTGETYGTTKMMTNHPYTLGSLDPEQYTKARGYYDDAMESWNNISDLFPNATPPKFPDQNGQ